MTLLNEVDKPGSDVEVYAKGLNRVLLKKIKIITDLRERLLNFYSHLKTEEHMSKLYERNQERANQSNGLLDQDAGADTQISGSQTMTDATGNLVDDILNEVYDDGQHQNGGGGGVTHEDLLGGDDHCIDDVDLLN